MPHITILVRMTHVYFPDEIAQTIDSLMRIVDPVIPPFILTTHRWCRLMKTHLQTASNLPQTMREVSRHNGQRLIQDQPMAASVSHQTRAFTSDDSPDLR